MRDKIKTAPYLSKDKLQTMQSYCIAVAMFFPAIKVSISLFFIMLVLFLEVLKFDYIAAYKKLTQHASMKYVLLLFLLFPLSMLWSDNFSWSMSMVKYYIILAFVPIFVLGIKEKDTGLYLLSFVSGVLFLSVLSYFVHFGYFLNDRFLGFIQYDATPFTNHMIFNVFVSFSVYIILDHYLFAIDKISLANKVALWLVVLFFSVSVFYNHGRIGQISLFLLFFIFAYRYFKNNLNSMCCIWFLTSLTLLLVFTMLFLSNQTFHDRFVLALDQVINFIQLSDVKLFAQGYEQYGGNSVGGRLFMWVESFKIFLGNPIVGTGVGDFPDVYNQLTGGKNSPLSMFPFSDHIHPHNQILYFMSALGALGVSFFLLLIYKMIYVLNKVNDDYKFLRLGFVAMFLLIIQSDCYLFIQPLALLFVFVVSALFSGSALSREKNIY